MVGTLDCHSIPMLYRASCVCNNFY